MEKEGSLMFFLDPEVHQLKGQLQSTNMMISKKKWLVMDNSEMLPQKVNGQLQESRFNCSQHPEMKLQLLHKKCLRTLAFEGRSEHSSPLAFFLIFIF